VVSGAHSINDYTRTIGDPTLTNVEGSGLAHLGR